MKQNKEILNLVKPWVRLILGVIYDLKYTTTVDDWSTKKSYIEVDRHIEELEKSINKET